MLTHLQFPGRPALFALSMHALVFANTSSAAITGVYLPHGPATPANPAWAPTAYRDIPWWFTDTNPEWGSATPGAADAYDISAVWAARLNRNNISGYEAAIINTPAYPHLLGGGNPYGSPGGVISPSLDNVTWGNNQKWSFSLTYAWNAGAPTAGISFTSGSTTHATTVNLGSRVIDFVEGDVARPLTAGGQPNPYREPHQLNDMMMRFATIGTYGATPAVTMTSLTVANLTASINGGAAQNLNYNDQGGVLQTGITTRWDHVSGGDANTNPRKVEFLVFNNILPDHTASLNLTGEITFAWTGAAASIAQSGLMFEAKLGDLDYFPAAFPNAVVPEVHSSLLGMLSLTLLGLRRRRA